MPRLHFDLLLLHKEMDNVDPRKWIIASGTNLKSEVKALLNDIFLFCNKNDLINQVATKLGCNSFLSEDSEIQTFYKEIRDKIEHSSLTKSQLSSLTGTSGGHFNKILLGNHFPSCAKIQKLQRYLGKFIALKINCQSDDFCLKKISHIDRSLSGDEVPLVILKELFDMWNILTNCTEQESRRRKREILMSIEYLKLNQHVSIWLKAPKILDEDFSKIVGSFCADGCFTFPDMFRWGEEHKSNLEALCKWLYSSFGIECSITRPRLGKNSWHCRFRSKVFARYMETFFGFKPGLKQYTVRAPEIIRNSPQSIQKAFAMGALMFDGSVNNDGTISFTVASKAFRDDTADILLQDNIPVSVAKEPNIKNHWFVGSGRSLKICEKRSLLDYFEEKTVKWIRLKEYLDGFETEIKSISEAKKILTNRFYHLKNPSLAETLEWCSQKSKFNIYDAMEHFSSKRHLLLSRLVILESIKSLSSKRSKRRHYTYNPDILVWRLPSLESF